MHGKQQLVLLRLKTMLLGRHLAEMEKPPDLPPEFGQVAILIESQVAVRTHGYIVSRSILGKSDASPPGAVTHGGYRLAVDRRAAIRRLKGEATSIRGASPRARSRIESLAQPARDGGAQIVAPPENAVANARDEVIQGIAQRARDDGQEGRGHLPSTAEPPQNMDAGIRADEERSILGLHDQAVGQAGAALRRNPRLECLAL